MITTDMNSADTIVRFDQIEQNEEKKANISTGQSPNGEQYVYEIEDQNNKTQLEFILAEQQEKAVLEQQERQRLERIKKLPITIKRQLSTINELSDQSINQSASPQQDHETVTRPKEILFEIQEENKLQQKEGDLSEKRHLHKKKKKKKKVPSVSSSQTLSIPDIEYQKNMNLKFYYKDQRIDCSWKLLFSYFTLIIISNIILQTIEVVRYSQSVCQLEGMENLFIYSNQILYVCGKIGVLSLNYQEFTNTLPTKSKIPLLNSVMFSSIFIVLSMPLYVFDFVLCQPRNNLFTLTQSLYILNFLDWCFISVIGIFIFLHLCLKISLKKKTWKSLKKLLAVIYYLFLLLIHLLQVLITFTQSLDNLLPSMIMENYYLFFSILTMAYLSIYKFCCHKEPFDFCHVPLNNEPVILIMDEKIKEEQHPNVMKLTKRSRLSPASSQFNSVQTTQINLVPRKY